MNNFDFNKIKDFDRHINLSIPNYEWLTNEIVQFSQYFIEKDSNVYDLGCSTGKLIERMSEMNYAHYFGIDNSNLLPSSSTFVKYLNQDLSICDLSNASFITSIFTLQFLSSFDRKNLINKVFSALNKGGAFVVCEKTYSKTSKLQDITNSKYYEFKEKNFTVKEILEKERQLRNSLRLKTFDELMQEMSYVGDVEVFWRCFNFVGFIVIKK